MGVGDEVPAGTTELGAEVSGAGAPRASAVAGAVSLAGAEANLGLGLPDEQAQDPPMAVVRARVMRR